MDLETFKQIIRTQCFSSNNEERFEAESIYSGFVKENFLDATNFLLQLMVDPTINEIAVVLFSTLTRQMGELSQENYSEILKTLFQLFQAETATLTFRNSIGYSINNITKLIEGKDDVIRTYFELFCNENDEISISAFSWAKTAIYSRILILSEEQYAQLNGIFETILQSESSSNERKVACCELLISTNRFPEYSPLIFAILSSLDNEEDICKLIVYISECKISDFFAENAAGYLEFFINVAKSEEFHTKTKTAALLATSHLFDLLKSELYSSIVEVVAELIRISETLEDYEPLEETGTENSFLIFTISIINDIISNYSGSTDLYVALNELMETLFAEVAANPAEESSVVLLISTLEFASVLSEAFIDLSPPLDLINEVDFLLELSTNENPVVRYAIIKAFRKQTNLFKDSNWGMTFEISGLVEKIFPLTAQETVPINKKMCLSIINSLNILNPDEMAETFDTQMEILGSIETDDISLINRVLKNMKFFVNKGIEQYYEAINQYAAQFIDSEYQSTNAYFTALLVFTSILVRQDDEYIEQNRGSIYEIINGLSFSDLVDSNIGTIYNIFWLLKNKSIDLVLPLIEKVITESCAKINEPLKLYEFSLDENPSELNDFYYIKSAERNVYEGYLISDLNSLEISIYNLESFVGSGIINEELFPQIIETLKTKFDPRIGPDALKMIMNVFLCIATMITSNDYDAFFVGLMIFATETTNNDCTFFKYYQTVISKILERNPEGCEHLDRLLKSLIVRLLIFNIQMKEELKVSKQTDDLIMTSVEEKKADAKTLFESIVIMRNANQEIYDQYFVEALESGLLQLEVTDIEGEMFIMQEIPQLFALYVIGNPASELTGQLFSFLEELVQVNKEATFETIVMFIKLGEAAYLPQIDNILFNAFSQEFVNQKGEPIYVSYIITYAFSLYIVNFSGSQNVAQAAQFLEQAMASSIQNYQRIHSEKMSLVFLTYLKLHENNPGDYLEQYKHYSKPLIKVTDDYSRELYSIVFPSVVEAEE